MFWASKPLLAIWHYMFLLVAEKILVPISVISVIRLRLFVLHYNYLSICSLGRNLCSSGRNIDSWRWIMGGGGGDHISYLAFETLILKRVNKIKLDNFWPSCDPSKEACFFHFLNSLKEIWLRPVAYLY